MENTPVGRPTEGHWRSEDRETAGRHMVEGWTPPPLFARSTEQTGFFLAWHTVYKTWFCPVTFRHFFFPKLLGKKLIKICGNLGRNKNWWNFTLYKRVDCYQMVLCWACRKINMTRHWWRWTNVGLSKLYNFLFEASRPHSHANVTQLELRSEVRC